MTEKYYHNKTLWWDRYIKPRIQQIFQREGASRNRDRRGKEDFYYDAIHHSIRSPLANENVAPTIRRLKAKILRLASSYMRGVLIDTVENDKPQGEDITTYHNTGSRKRQKTRLVKHILDGKGQH